MEMYSEVIRGEMSACCREIGDNSLNVYYVVYDNGGEVGMITLDTRDYTYKVSNFQYLCLLNGKQLKALAKILKDINKRYRELKNA